MKKILFAILAVLASATPLSAQVTPNNCPSNKFARGISSNGSLICSFLSDQDVPNDLTVVTPQQVIVTKDPATNQSSSASLRVNPLTSSTNEKLLAIQDNGSDRFTVDKEGDAVLAGDLIVSGDITGSLSGSVTVDELSANPADCAANQFANAIAANGDLTCSALADADIPNTITVNLAAAATALAANPTDCGGGNFATAIAANGDLTCSTAVTSVATGTGLTGGAITGTGTVSLKFTDTLAGNPALSTGQSVFDSGDAGGGLLFEGTTADAFEGFLSAGDPTTDRTWTFPDATGTIALTTSSISGNAATATALSSNGGNCSAGSFPLGVDTSGAAESCSATTFPTTAATSGKFIRSDGTNWVASTPTLPTSAGTAGKVLTSDGTNYVESTPTFPNASASSGKFIRSDGTNWIASTPTLPTSAGTSGKVLQSNGTNYIESSATYPASTTANQILYSSASNTVGEITAANNGTVMTDSAGAPTINTAPNGAFFHNLAIVDATTTNAHDSIKITSAGGSALSATNSGWIDLPATTAGQLTRFPVTADVTIKLSGATPNINGTGNLTGALWRVLADNDNGTLRWCASFLGGRTTLLTTDTNATQTNITAPEHVLCNTAVGSATNTVKEFGFVRSDFTDATDVWANQTGVGDIVTGNTADGLWKNCNTTLTGFSSNPTTIDCRWMQTGETIYVTYGTNSGTSNATSYTMTAPVKNRSPSGIIRVVAGGYAIDNGTQGTIPGVLQMTGDSTTTTFYKDASQPAWTNSGSKRWVGNWFYEAGPAASFIQ